MGAWVLEAQKNLVLLVLFLEMESELRAPGSGGSGRLQGYEAVPGQGSKWGHDSCARSVSSPVEQGPRPQQAVSAHTRTAAWTDLQRLPDDPYCGPMHWKNTNG